MHLLTQGPHKLLGQELWLLVAPGEQDVAIKSMAASQSLPAGEASGPPDMGPEVWLSQGLLPPSLVYTHPT